MAVQEWPLPQPGAPDEAAPMLPLALDEHVALILASPAIDAFARKRAVQMVTHGQTAEQDLERTVDFLAYEAKQRLHAFTDVVGRDRAMNLPPERREQCLRYVEIAGALCIALWERLQVEVPDGEA